MRRFHSFICIGVALASPAFACSTLHPLSEEQQFENAKEVFVAHVTKTEEAKYRDDRFPGDLPVVEARYLVTEAIKGSPASEGVVRDFVFGYGNCSLGILAGTDYLFFVGDESRLVPLPSGSRGLVNPNAEPVKQLLEKLRSLAKSKQ